MKKITVFSFLLFSSQLSAPPVRVYPNENMIKALVSFHRATGTATNSPRPSVAGLKKRNRLFLAKMDSFGIDRWFQFETDEDIAALAEGVSNGGGRSVAWFYYDAQNVVVISGDYAD